MAGEPKTERVERTQRQCVEKSVSMLAWSRRNGKERTVNESPGLWGKNVGVTKIRFSLSCIQITGKIEQFSMEQKHKKGLGGGQPTTWKPENLQVLSQIHRLIGD